MKKHLLLIALAMCGSVALSAQDGPIKDYAEDISNRKFCFYPSTLRMINLTNDIHFDELVSGINKLLIYQIPQTRENVDNYRELLKAYRELDFEEYARLDGGGNRFILLGKESFAKEQYVGIAGQEDMLLAFYLTGDIGWENIPAMMRQIQSDNMLNILDFNQPDFDD